MLILPALLALLPALVAAVKTTNAKMAATLSSVAVRIPAGTYTIKNVKTGQSLFYNPRGNAIYPAKTASTVKITVHSGEPWVRLQFGKKNKCLSSAWGGEYNNAAVMYMCAVGSTGVKTTLEPTKQWWLAVNVKKTNGNSKASTAALLAAQLQSVKTRAKKIAAAKAAFNNRLAKRDETASLDGNATAISEQDEETLFADLVADSEEKWEQQYQLAKRSAGLVRRKKKATKKKAAPKVVGTFYLIPSDHLIDLTTRALTGKIYNSRGVKTTSLQVFSTGNKAQQWIITKH